MEHSASGLTVEVVSTSKGCDTTLTDFVLRHATERNVGEGVRQAEKHVNEQLSYGGIFPSTGPFGSALEYRYHDGDLVAEIGQMRRLASALKQLADALESDAE